MNAYYGIVNATAAAGDGVPVERARYCLYNTLDHNLIKGKIVVCTAALRGSRSSKGDVVQNGGGVGMILIDPFFGNQLPTEYAIPTTVLGPKEIEILTEYLTIEQNPTAIIHRTETVIDNAIPAPDMALFSSMGPNIVATDIIKPDITAPGVNILAAWSPVSIESAGKSVNYKFDSGTSMSCPHVSAVAAIIKSHHPDWSPAAIKSAIMTTATVTHKTGGGRISKNMDGSSTTPFDYGSGHINPVAALDPGLIYEYGTDGMIGFICSSANLQQIPLLLATCPDKPIRTHDLNYPSIGIANMNGSVTVHRTVTYYGQGPAIFESEVILDNPNVKFIVTPKQLDFKEAGENISFSVNFMADSTSPGSLVFGSLTWSYGKGVAAMSSMMLPEDVVLEILIRLPVVGALLFIWNPTTGEYKILPGSQNKVRDHDHSSIYSFGYDSKNDDCKLVKAEFSDYLVKFPPSERMFMFLRYIR
ncbi:subtilisin-like protease SBT1.7 [Papaver somniferum]|uniref:subtilisin-like protease SBT1.7 n=1 Tax=Papaver somniferum TaxID=3469 RepID=UPI000E700950|nr:subtilisin-like protease SBT1.7 [Papaver somniferum]